MTLNRKHLSSYDNDFKQVLGGDPKFKEIWESNKTKREAAVAVMGERIKQKMTQQQLAQKAGLKQPNVARVEGGQNVSILTLSKIAKAFGKHLKISFEEPKTKTATS